jgi:hypothetical protein
MDGIQISHYSPMGQFAFGLWYTGALYKKNARIYMTPMEEAHYNEPLVYSDFTNTYFAPRRSVFAFDWAHPSLGSLANLKISLVGQFDMNNGRFSPDIYHSQYIIMKANVPVSSVLFELGGSIGTSQFGNMEEGVGFNNISLAGEAAVRYIMPTKNSNMVSLTGRHATGLRQEGSPFEMFIPITSKYLGEILEIKFSGITAISLDFSSRLHKSLGTFVSASYFIRGNNLISEYIYPDNENINTDGKFLGAEIYSKVVWSPYSDLSFNLGGGLFAPAVGNYWETGKPIWRIELSTGLGLR